MFLARSAGHGFFIFSILPLFFFTACIGGGGGGGYLSRLTLGHGITNIGYARALPWLRRPHHIERSRSSLRATFAEAVFFLVPTLTIEQITNRSRNLADNYDETEFSFSISRSY